MSLVISALGVEVRNMLFWIVAYIKSQNLLFVCVRDNKQ